ncbi:MAG: 6-phosphogluconolactonase [Actinomycetota bacterium]|nr:6-phosphogluconolactonase [Actinomycetota bacterium]
MTLFGEVRVVEDVPGAFADLLVEEAPESVALSGGSLARRCYQDLASRHLAWDRISVFFGDERVVPVDSDDSNEGMARRALLDAAQPAAIHSLVGLGAGAYDVLVRSVPPIDVVHLGLGADGHTASLFPGAPQLDVADRFVVDAGDAQHPHPRITFTFPAIARCRLAVVTVAGEDKRNAWRRVNTSDDLPASRIRAPRVLWLVDPTVL